MDGFRGCSLFGLGTKPYPKCALKNKLPRVASSRIRKVEVATQVGGNFVWRVWMNLSGHHFQGDELTNLINLMEMMCEQPCVVDTFLFLGGEYWRLSRPFKGPCYLLTAFVCGGSRKCKMSGETPSWSHISCETFQQQPAKKAQHRTCKNTMWKYTRVKFIGHSKWAELKSYPLLTHSNEFGHWKPWFWMRHAKSKMTQL